MDYLTEYKAKKVLKKFRIPVTKEILVRDADHAIKAASEIGYPLAMKVMSPDILHKTEAGVVKVNIRNDVELVSAYMELLKKAMKYKKDAVIEGILLEEMVSGHEISIGGKRDSQFGPVIMFSGLGGIYVEILKDVSFRVCPITKKDAMEMIKETKGYELLKGFRGKQGIDLGKLFEVMVNVSKLIMKKSVLELDINPLFASKERIVAADARIVLEG